MKFNQLNVKGKGSPKRVGRGIAAGQGKTAGRGTKGQGSRAGSSRKPGFEGGQNPLMQRLPKLKGFRRHVEPVANVYTGQLDDLKSKQVDAAVLAKAGLIPNAHVNVKLIVKGSVSKPMTVKLTGASRAAVEQLEQAGGSFETAPRIARTKKSVEESSKAV